MNIRHIDIMINQITNYKFALMRKHNYSNAELTKYDEKLIKLYKLKSDLERAEKRNAVIDSILN